MQKLCFPLSLSLTSQHKDREKTLSLSPLSLSPCSYQQQLARHVPILYQLPRRARGSEVQKSSSSSPTHARIDRSSPSYGKRRRRQIDDAAAMGGCGEGGSMAQPWEHAAARLTNEFFSFLTELTETKFSRFPFLRRTDRFLFLGIEFL